MHLNANRISIYCKRAIFYVLFIVVQLLNYILARIVATIFGACFCAFCLKNRPIQDGRDFTYEIEEKCLKWDQLENEKKFDYILSNWVNEYIPNGYEITN
eukprot:959013_1